MLFKFNMDASENAFFSKQLEALRIGLFAVQYARLKAAELVPINTSINIGAESYAYRWYDRVGTAVISSDQAEKGPRVDIKGAEGNQVIRSIKASYGYSLQEARASIMAGADLPNRKAVAARETINTALDTVLLMGDVAAGLKGLFTLAGTATFTVPNGAAGSPLWSTKTPDEIVQDMHAMVFQVEQDSLEVEKCDTMILPLAYKGLVSSTRMGDGSNQTILSHFLETNGSIKTVEFSQKLNASTQWSGKRAMAYKRDPSKLEGIVPIAFEQMQPQYDGYEVTTQCHCRTGGVVVYMPKSVIYADGI